MNILYKTTTAILSLILSTNILPSTKPKTEDNNLIYCCSISYQVRFKFSCCNKGKAGDNKTKLDIKECLKSQKIQDNKPWFKNYYLSNKCDNLILAVKNCQLNLHQSKTSCFKKESSEFVNDEEILDEDSVCSDVVICGPLSKRNFIIDQCGSRPLISSIELESSFDNTGLCWD